MEVAIPRGIGRVVRIWIVPTVTPIATVPRVATVTATLIVAGWVIGELGLLQGPGGIRAGIPCPCWA